MRSRAKEATRKALAPVTRLQSEEIEEARAAARSGAVANGATRVEGEEASKGDHETRHDRLKPGVALCLSGGGYRAMLFHVGTLWRLNELGYLPRLSRVSSVSGGSITAGVLALGWERLAFKRQGDGEVAERFKEEVVAPIRRLARKSIDYWAVLGGLFLGGTVSTYVAAFYRRHLFDDRSLQELPAPGMGPDFIINASNLQSGVLWQFSREFAGDYLVGWLRNPRISVAQAVAASSAFPPFLSPAVFKFDPREERFEPSRYSDLNEHKTGGSLRTTGKARDKRLYTTRVLLTDGGVYDNMGLETAWKYYGTVLVSDGGGKMPAEPRPGRDWFRQFLRIRDMTDNQVRGLRKRQLIASYEAEEDAESYRQGAYWGMRTDILDYRQPGVLECPPEQTEKLANIGTRLSSLDSVTQERLINWGYAICDAAMRRHVVRTPVSQPRFPYPDAKVGR